MSLTKPKGSFSRVILLILAAALLVRGAMLLVVVENPERALRRDSGTYLIAANNLVNGHGLSQRQEAPYEPSAIRTPTYPLFLAGMITLFGHNTAAMAAVQVLIDVASVYLIYVVGRRLFSEKIALLGGLLYALSLVAIVHSVFILTETLFTFLILGVVTAITLYRSGERMLWLIAAAALSGLAILCRPIAVFFPALILFSIGLVHRKRLKGAVGPALLYLFLTALTVAPWLVRNNQLLGKPTLSTISNSSLLTYNAVALEADRRGISQDSARREIISRADSELAKNGWEENEVRRDNLYGLWGREIIASDPVRYLFIHLKSDLNSLLPAVADFLELLGVTEGAKGTLSVLNQYGLVAAVNHYFEGRTWLLWPLSPLIILLGLTYAGAALGALRLAVERRWFALSILLLTALYFLVITGPASNPRFRVPAMPTLCLLAGVGLIYLVGWLSAKGWLGRRAKSLAAE